MRWRNYKKVYFIVNALCTHNYVYYSINLMICQQKHANFSCFYIKITDFFRYNKVHLIVLMFLITSSKNIEAMSISCIAFMFANAAHTTKVYIIIINNPYRSDKIYQ